MARVDRIGLAEEGGNGKYKLLRKGAYEGMDACLMYVPSPSCHALIINHLPRPNRAHPVPGPKNTAGTGSSMAMQEFIVEYFGHTSVIVYLFPPHVSLRNTSFRAHAAKFPWEAQNALDAAFVAYASISALRQQIKVGETAS
jgi:metal-dependent amidase/aminoacylase/carboxypeptidase family protein